MIYKSDKHTTEIDKKIGKKIQLLRLSRGFSRLQLSQNIGVTSQQLRKYEKGINRISAGRMVIISKALGETISYFYEDLHTERFEPLLKPHQRMCIEVARNFMKIENPNHQIAVSIFIKSLTEDFQS